jgi:hypothetical protein
VYLVISIGTIPFINSIWIGDLPVLAVIQLPKIAPANLLRHSYAVGLAEKLNISTGSFSPDYIFIRPYALLIVYILALLILVFCYALFIKNRKEGLKYLLILLFIAILDFYCTLHFSDTPALTLY